MTHRLDPVRSNNKVGFESFAIFKIQRGSFRTNFDIEQSLVKVQNILRKIFCKSVQKVGAIEACCVMIALCDSRGMEILHENFTAFPVSEYNMYTNQKPKPQRRCTHWKM